MTKKDYELLLRDGWRKDEGYVFVSYSSQDWDKVYPCVLELRTRGINVFIDVEFQENSSSSWLRNLEDRLLQDDDCKGVVAFVSTSYLCSYACLTELIANRTDMQRLEKGGTLPVFYIALDEALSTPQKMSRHIYSGAVKKQLRSHAVKMESEECTTLENYLLDCHLARYPDRESIRHLLLKPIKTKFNIAAIMCDLIFSDTTMMPNIQPFDGAAECAELLMRNFVNDKNDSIELPILEELRLETRERLRKPEEKSPAPEPVKPENSAPKLVKPESPAPKPVKPESPAPKLVKPESPAAPKRPGRSPADRLMALAESGNDRAQFSLGLRYEKGEGVERDMKQAVYWYRKAADQRYANAENALGVCYAKGAGVEQNWETAAYWYRRAAEQGHANAQNNLGQRYEKGQGVYQDREQAFYWYQMAADQGNVYAQVNLGNYYYGSLKKQDAIYWYQKAAEQGYAEAQYHLGFAYYYGVERDEKQAAYWYQKAADQGHVEAQRELGYLYWNDVWKREQAFHWYRMAADQGHARAQYDLAECYKEGCARVKQDWEQAAYWYRKAAEQGHVSAQYELGVRYEKGEGVEQDWKQALYWYRKSAEAEYGWNAQYRLGRCYDFGEGVEQNWKQAVHWYRKAAEGGKFEAQYNLGWCYEKGQGVQRDVEQAVYWYEKAAPCYEGARVQLNRLRQEMK